MPTWSLALAVVVTAAFPAPAAAQSTDDPPPLSIFRASGGEPLLGAISNLAGSLSTGDRRGQRIVLEADRFPFDGVFEPVAETTTDDTGGYEVTAPLTISTRFRAVAPDRPDRPQSKLIETTAQLGYRLVFRRGTRPPRVTAILRGPRWALDGRRLYVYRFAYRRTTGTRVGRIVLRSTGDRRASGRARLRLRRIRLGDSIIVCLREAVDDGVGPHSPLQRRCGNRRVSAIRAGDPGLGILLTTLD